MTTDKTKPYYAHTDQVKDKLVEELNDILDNAQEPKAQSYLFKSAIYKTKPNVSLDDYSGRTYYSSQFNILMFCKDDKYGYYHLPTVRAKEIVQHATELPTMFKDDSGTWVESIRCHRDEDWILQTGRDYDVSKFQKDTDNFNEKYSNNIIAKYDSSTDMLEYEIITHEEMQTYMKQIEDFFVETSKKREEEKRFNQLKADIKDLTQDDRAKLLSMLIN